MSNEKTQDESFTHLEGKTATTIAELNVERQQEEELLTIRIEREEKKIKQITRKLDARLISTLAILYVWAFIDRGNLANALIAGMDVDLELVGNNRYSILAVVFFVGYTVADLPSTWAVSRIGPTIWVPASVIAFGVITMAQGFTHSWTAVLACRILLGFLEGMFVPVAVFMISVWYTRYQAHKRLAWFYVVGIGANGLSGLLAFAIDNMDGTAGMRGWRWIFIIEGIVTCVCGLVAIFTIVDLPSRANQRNLLGLPPFLSAEDTSLMQAYIERDRGDSGDDKLTFRRFLEICTDWKTWEFVLFNFLSCVALYAFAYFLPVILKGSLGYSTQKAQLYTFPPYAVAMPYLLGCAYICDKYRFRGAMLIFNATLYVIGVSMTGFLKDPSPRYGGVFISVAGLTGNIPTIWAYQQNNILGQAKRAVVTALMVMGSGIGGIISGNIFRAKDAPTYIPALSICLAFQVLTILLVAKNYFVFARANRKADRNELIIEGQPGFRYTF